MIGALVLGKRTNMQMKVGGADVVGQIPSRFWNAKKRIRRNCRFYVSRGRE